MDIPKVTAAALDALADGTYKHALSSDVIDAFPALDGVYHFHTENQRRISTPFLTRLLSSDLVSMKLQFVRFPLGSKSLFLSDHVLLLFSTALTAFFPVRPKK